MSHLHVSPWSIRNMPRLLLVLKESCLTLLELCSSVLCLVLVFMPLFHQYLSYGDVRHSHWLSQSSGFPLLLMFVPTFNYTQFSCRFIQFLFTLVFTFGFSAFKARGSCFIHSTGSWNGVGEHDRGPNKARRAAQACSSALVTQSGRLCRMRETVSRGHLSKLRRRSKGLGGVICCPQISMVVRLPCPTDAATPDLVAAQHLHSGRDGFVQRILAMFRLGASTLNATDEVTVLYHRSFPL